MPFKRILVPVDGSEPAKAAVVAGARLAKQVGGALAVLHVVEDGAYLIGLDPQGGASGAIFSAIRDSGQACLADAAALAQQEGVEAAIVFHDKPPKRLADAVDEVAQEWAADLIAVGTHGRRGASRLLLGSGAEQIIRSASIPVLVIRAPASKAS